MKLINTDIPADLNAKIEKVMLKTGKSWGESILFLLAEVVSPSPRFIEA